ncbi:hypothetical protein HAX54_029222, partial [Datura stramonium]|nr:hypothetical protein [Datura stramonium]
LLSSSNLFQIPCVLHRAVHQLISAVVAFGIGKTTAEEEIDVCKAIKNKADQAETSRKKEHKTKLKGKEMSRRKSLEDDDFKEEIDVIKLKKGG